MRDEARDNIKQGIGEVKKGLLRLQGSVFPYGALGALTDILQGLADGLENAYLHEYTPKGDLITPVKNGEPIND